MCDAFSQATRICLFHANFIGDVLRAFFERIILSPRYTSIANLFHVLHLHRMLKKSQNFPSTMSILANLIFMTWTQNQSFPKNLIGDRRFYSPVDTLTAILKSPDPPRWPRRLQKLAQTIFSTWNFKFHKSDGENCKKSVKISSLGDDLTIDEMTQDNPQRCFRDFKYLFSIQYLRKESI